MAALLVGLGVMAVLMSMALPVWSQMAKREKEEELIWRGKQYARAVGLFQRKFANTFPPTVDILVEQRFLRKKYKDPMTKDEFQMIPAGGGQPGRSPAGAAAERQRQPADRGRLRQIAQGRAGLPARMFGGRSGPRERPEPRRRPPSAFGGVVSKSSDASIKIYNGRRRYNEWAFVYSWPDVAGTRSRWRTAALRHARSPGQPGGRAGPMLAPAVRAAVNRSGRRPLTGHRRSGRRLRPTSARGRARHSARRHSALRRSNRRIRRIVRRRWLRRVA